MTIPPITSKVLSIRRHCDELDEIENNPFHSYPSLTKRDLYAFRRHPDYRLITLQLQSWVTNACFDEAPFRSKALEIFVLFIINKDETTLNLSSLNLTSLPPIFGIQDFKERLKTLYLCRNSLREFPEEFYDLKELETLSIAHNNFTDLSERIGQLTKLISLSLNGNKISSFPNQLILLTSLIELNIAENGLKEIPEIIYSLTQLKKLCAHQNQISEISDRIEYLKNLEELSLANNLIEKISEKVDELKLLKELVLYNNHLSSFPEEVCHLVKLEVLLMGNNKIKTFPNQFGRLIHLKTLTLSNTTTLTDIPKQLYDLPKTCQVDLRQCPIPLLLQKECYEIMSQKNYSGPKFIFNLYLWGINEALNKETAKSKLIEKV